MRNRSTALVFALVLVPAALSAQRGVGIRIGTQPRPAALPPMAPTIAREMNYAYRRMAFSTETYPMINTVTAVGFLTAGSTSSWTSYGMGQRLSIRIKPYVFGTLDMTAAPFGGLTNVSTVEVGTRLLPDVWDHKIHPYVDARVGYAFAYEGYGNSSEYGIGNSYVLGTRISRYSEGFGGVVGAGISFSLTRTTMLVLGSSFMQNNMSNHQITEATTGTGPESYKLTSFRHTIGLRWNPVRSIPNIPNETLQTGR